MLHAIGFLTEWDETEIAILRGHMDFHPTLHERLLLQAVGDEIFDGDDLHIPLFGYLYELRETSHCPIFVNDFYEGCYRLHAREASKVYGSLGMPGTAKHPTRARTKRIHMPGASQIRRLRLGVG